MLQLIFTEHIQPLSFLKIMPHFLIYKNEALPITEVLYIYIYIYRVS